MQSNTPSRNSACSCGSGRRYKDCHGAIPTGLRSTASADDLAQSGLEWHRRGNLDLAAQQYSEALQLDATHFNSLHMLGVIALQQKRYRDCLTWLRQAGHVVDWDEPNLLSNLRLAVSGFLADIPDSRRIAERGAVAKSALATATASCLDPLVSVIVPSYCHARYVSEALRSVFAQTWRRIEVIVIDDGSTDDSVEVIRSILAEAPFPARFIHRENRGAHATINQGLALATGDYVNILNSDDQFTPKRVARLVHSIAHGGRQWGFARCTVIDDLGRPITTPHENADALLHVMSWPSSSACASDYLVHCNPSISSGNLFFRRELGLKIGGFSSLRYNHDWEFCLNAVLVEEPCVVPEDLYIYRLHGSNTITENRAAAKREAEQMLMDWFARTAHPYVAANALAGTQVNDPLFWECTQIHVGAQRAQTDDMISTLLNASLE